MSKVNLNSEKAIFAKAFHEIKEFEDKTVGDIVYGDWIARSAGNVVTSEYSLLTAFETLAQYEY